jgi:CDP-diacylglycerol--serine O-phosphatidyltransferase
MRHLPNTLTMANLFCGCCAFVCTLYGLPVQAAWFIAGSFLCDYADGMLARALKVSGPLGKELDSLADVVSFGAVPGAMLFVMLSESICGTGAGTWDVSGGLAPGSWDLRKVICLAALPAFILTAFSALRLGKFNLDTRQANYFIGLSTPATTVFILGLRLATHHDRFGLRDALLQPWLLYAVIALFSFLLISEIPMFGMKIKRFDLKSNALNLAFLAILLVLVFAIKELALSAIIVIYLLTSLLLKKRVLASPA